MDKFEETYKRIIAESSDDNIINEAFLGFGGNPVEKMSESFIRTYGKKLTEELNDSLTGFLNKSENVPKKGPNIKLKDVECSIDGYGTKEMEFLLKFNSEKLDKNFISDIENNLGKSKTFQELVGIKSNEDASKEESIDNAVSESRNIFGTLTESGHLIFEDTTSSIKVISMITVIKVDEVTKAGSWKAKGGAIKNYAAFSGTVYLMIEVNGKEYSIDIASIETKQKATWEGRHDGQHLSLTERLQKMEAEGIAGYLFNNRKRYFKATLEVLANSKWENHEQKDNILKKLLGLDGSRIKKKIDTNLNAIKEKDEKSYNQYLKEYNDEIIPSFEEEKDKSILSAFLKELEAVASSTKDQENSDNQTLAAFTNEVNMFYKTLGKNAKERFNTRYKKFKSQLENKEIDFNGYKSNVTALMKAFEKFTKDYEEKEKGSKSKQVLESLIEKYYSLADNPKFSDEIYDTANNALNMKDLDSKLLKGQIDKLKAAITECEQSSKQNENANETKKEESGEEKVNVKSNDENVKINSVEVEEPKEKSSEESKSKKEAKPKSEKE